MYALQIGCALGFVIPPEIVTNSDDIAVIGSQLRIMLYSGAALMTFLFILVIICTLLYASSQSSLCIIIDNKRMMMMMIQCGREGAPPISDRPSLHRLLQTAARHSSGGSS